MLLFGIPAARTSEGSGAWDDEGIVQLATRAIKAAHPDLLVITDVCLCEYTSHGHCGVLRADGDVDNDASLELLARTAVSQARAGADVVAPSDMMDGRVGAIRAALDETASPTRRSSPTARSSPPPSTARSARPPTPRPPSATAAATRWTRPTRARRVREALLDVEEGADVVMVKPALPYLDVIRARQGRRPAAGRRVQRQRRVRDGQGGGRRRACSTSAPPSSRR